MKWMLFLLVSCAVTTVKTNNNRLNYKQVPQDAQSIEAASKILEKVSEEEKERIIQGYLRFYQFALKRDCGFTQEFLPGEGIKTLKLPPLSFVDLNIQSDEFIKNNTFSFMDVSTDLKEQQHYYFGQEAQRAGTVFFEERETPPLLSEGKLHLMLMRSGIGINKKFTMCAIHGQKQNLCVEDEITKTFVDINNKEEFCFWLSRPLNLSEKVKDDTLNYLIRVLKVIEVL